MDGNVNSSNVSLYVHTTSYMAVLLAVRIRRVLQKTDFMCIEVFNSGRFRIIQKCMKDVALAI